MRRLQRLLSITLLACVLGAVSLSARAATSVGKVIISIGDVVAVDSKGSERKLKRRSSIFEGDTIKVAANGRIQIRFIDKQLIALKANTEFRIDEYKFRGKADGSDSVALSLLKGGMRSVTGVIGKVNRDKYKLRTPVATLGVRGTHYVLQLCAANCGAGFAGGLYGSVLEGSVVMSNKGGQSEFGQDQFFHVATADIAPRAIIAPPPILIAANKVSKKKKTKKTAKKNAKKLKGPSKKPTAPNQLPALPDDPAFAAGEEGIYETDDGEIINTSVLPIASSPAPFGAGIAIAGISADGSVDPAGGDVALNGANGELIALADPPFPIPNIPVKIRLVDMTTTDLVVLQGASLSEVGGDPLGVNWGRWTTNVVLIEDGTTKTLLGNSFAFVYSPNITSPMTLVGITSGTPTYNFAGGPTIRDESGAVVTGTASIGIDFGLQQITAFNFNLSGNSRTYNASLMGTGVAFTDLYSGGDLPLSGSCTGGACGASTALTGSGGGLFVGASAQAIIGYFGLNGTNAAGDQIGVAGAGIFK